MAALPTDGKTAYPTASLRTFSIPGSFFLSLTRTGPAPGSSLGVCRANEVSGLATPARTMAARALRRSELVAFMLDHPFQMTVGALASRTLRGYWGGLKDYGPRVGDGVGPTCD